MSHPKSFLDAPIREDRGRRILLEKSHYQDFNFLHDHRPLEEQYVHPVGVSSGRQSHFKVGFFRRPASQIRQDEQRVQHEQHAEQRWQYQLELRRQLKQHKEGETMKITGEHKDEYNFHAHTNSATPSSSAASSAAAFVREPQFQSKRHFPERNAETVPEEGRFGFGKFASKMTPEQLERRRQRLDEYTRRREQTSSLLGYGRSDLPSHGVLDNFIPITSSELSHLESRKHGGARRSASVSSASPSSSSASSSSSSTRPYVLSQVFPSSSSSSSDALRSPPPVRKTRYVKSQIAFLFGDHDDAPPSSTSNGSTSNSSNNSVSAPPTSHANTRSDR